MLSAFSILAGLILLIVGGELLVRGSVRVAERIGVSPLLIGLTLVGFGTSMPELVTSVQAALVGSPGIAVGNIVGSNVANILFILGISALIVPLGVHSSVLRRDGLFVVATAAMLTGVGWSVGLNRWVGSIFLALLVAYMVYAYRKERVLSGPGVDHTAAFDRAEAIKGVDPDLKPHAPAGAGTLRWLIPAAIAGGGLVMIVFGSRLLVYGAIEISLLFGLSESVIGLTIVAVGTSMPELVTSVVAALKRQADVALGNILGSNIYNVLGIGGVTALIAPTAVPEQIAWFDNPLMVAVSLLLLVFATTGARLSRREGAVFVLLYLSYLGWLIGGA